VLDALQHRIPLTDEFFIGAPAGASELSPSRHERFLQLRSPGTSSLMSIAPTGLDLVRSGSTAFVGVSPSGSSLELVPLRAPATAFSPPTLPDRTRDTALPSLLEPVPGDTSLWVEAATLTGAEGLSRADSGRMDTSVAVLPPNTFMEGSPLSTVADARASTLEEFVMESDIIAPTSALRALFHAAIDPMVPLSMTVHRVGPSLLLDGDPVSAMQRAQGPIDRVLGPRPDRSAIQEAEPFQLLADGSPPPSGKGDDSASAWHPETMPVFRTIASKADDVDDVPPHLDRRFVLVHGGVSVMTSPAYVAEDEYFARANARTIARESSGKDQTPDPETSPVEHLSRLPMHDTATVSAPAVPCPPPVPSCGSGFRRVATWNFRGMRLVLGSDLLVLRDSSSVASGDDGPSTARVSVAVKQESGSKMSRSEALGLYLENAASNVPEVLLCHVKPDDAHAGDMVISRMERIPTEDLTAVSAEPFSPYQAEQSAAELLAFLRVSSARELPIWLML
jgi:hypothetical protein